MGKMILVLDVRIKEIPDPEAYSHKFRHEPEPTK